MPHDVRWHFIGHLQSNKVKTLLEGCPNLAMLETVDSVKLANKLSNTVEACGREPLPVLIQVLPLPQTCCDEARLAHRTLDCSHAFLSEPGYIKTRGENLPHQ